MKNFFKNLRYLSFYELRIPLLISLIVITIIAGISIFSITNKTNLFKMENAKYVKNITDLKATSTKNGKGNELAEGSIAPKINDSAITNEYKNNSIISKLNDNLIKALEYKSTKDLTTAYSELKETIKGSFWSDMYGTLKPENTPAVNQFAATIDQQEKTASVESIKIFETETNHYIAIIIEKLDGNRQLKAPIGKNTYQFNIEKQDNTYIVNLQNKLS